MSKPKIKVEFNLFGEKIDFDRITNFFEIVPTEVKQKEEMKIPEYSEDSWTFSTGYKHSSTISIPFEELLDTLENKVSLINEIKAELKIQSNIIVIIECNLNERPEFILTNRCIEFAANTNSEIHFDNYFFD